MPPLPAGPRTCTAAAAVSIAPPCLIALSHIAPPCCPLPCTAATAACVAPLLLDFWAFFHDAAGPAARGSLSVRDLLSWVSFINTAAPSIGALPAYAHGAHLTLLDGVGLGAGMVPGAAAALRAKCHAYLVQQISASGVDGAAAAALHAEMAAGDLVSAPAELVSQGLLPTHAPEGRWGLPPFYVPSCLAAEDADAEPCPASGSGGARGGRGRAAGGFELGAPTTARNAFRVLRAMQLKKAVLLEGSPGVGKTTLIAALARRVGQTLVRINLSEATDMMDLLGADLPAQGGAPGQFVWCPGPLLAALQAGHWVLLDELNLAGQAVLEGLNALLDHR